MRRLKRLLDTASTVLCGWCCLTDPRYLETICGFDFDAIVLDMQHGFFDETTIFSPGVIALANTFAPAQLITRD